MMKNNTDPRCTILMIIQFFKERKREIKLEKGKINGNRQNKIPKQMKMSRKHMDGTLLSRNVSFPCPPSPHLRIPPLHSRFFPLTPSAVRSRSVFLFVFSRDGKFLTETQQKAFHELSSQRARVTKYRYRDSCEILSFEGSNRWHEWRL